MDHCPSSPAIFCAAIFTIYNYKQTYCGAWLNLTIFTSQWETSAGLYVIVNWRLVK